MLPQAPGVSKAKTGHSWGTKFDSFWCCYGTGFYMFCSSYNQIALNYNKSFLNSFICILIVVFLSLSFLGIESFSKLGDSIYFEEEGKDPTLYIIQYISSSFNWKSGGVVLNQTVAPAASWDPYLRVTVTFSPAEVLPIMFCCALPNILKFL